MTCKVVQLPTGERAIVCGPKRRKPPCCACGRPADLLCDWKVGPGSPAGGPVETCDKQICAKCSLSPAPGKDLCPEHAKAWDAWKAQRTGTSLRP